MKKAIKKNFLIKSRKQQFYFAFLTIVGILLIILASNGLNEVIGVERKDNKNKIDLKSSEDYEGVPIKDSNDQSPLCSSTGLSLECAISLNQSAYLPGSLMNVTLTLKNNYTTSLTNILFKSTLSKNLKITKGSLDYDFANLDVNKTVSNSFICRLPNSQPSLDLVFLIDGSGSMNDEIVQVKDKVIEMVHELLQEVSSVRIGFIFFGAVLYDENPYYDSQNVLDFTTDESEIINFLEPFSGNGGWEPWGDALHYLQKMSWDSSESAIRIGVLITDEPCNYGIYVGRSGGYDNQYDYYDGPELYAMVTQLKQMGITICTIECWGTPYGDYALLDSQLKQVAAISGGIFVKLITSENIMEEILTICRSIIVEYGIKITTEFTGYLEAKYLSTIKYKWVLIDNKPPSLTPTALPIYGWKAC